MREINHPVDKRYALNEFSIRWILANKNALDTQQEMNNLFWNDENSIEQCCAAHIVQCFKQYCSAALLHLTAMQNNTVDNIDHCICGQQNIVQSCYH